MKSHETFRYSVRQLCLAAVILISCGQPQNCFDSDGKSSVSYSDKIVSKKNEDKMNEDKENEITIFSTIEKSTADQLTLFYTVKNQSDQDIYLLNRIYKAEPEWKQTPELIYIYFQERDRLVHLFKGIPAPPVGKDPVSLISPYMTVVKRGNEFSEKIHISIPITEWDPFEMSIETKKSIMKTPPQEIYETFEGVYFSLQFIRKQEGTIEREEEIFGQQYILTTKPAAMPYPPIETMITPITKLKLPILLYR